MRLKKIIIILCSYLIVQSAFTQNWVNAGLNIFLGQINSITTDTINNKLFVAGQMFDTSFLPAYAVYDGAHCVTKDITIEYIKGNDGEAAQLMVFNQIGELIVSKILIDDKTTINLSNLSAGIYLYTIKQNGSILKSNKLIIIK